MSELKLRESIVAACLEMNRSGLNQGTSGNISLRWRDGLLITPTSLPYDQMTPDDIVFLGMDGRTEGQNQPSSEWRFHRDIMKAKPEVAAIVHAMDPPDLYPYKPPQMRRVFEAFEAMLRCRAEQALSSRSCLAAT